MGKEILEKLNSLLENDQIDLEKEVSAIEFELGFILNTEGDCLKQNCMRLGYYTAFRGEYCLHLFLAVAHRKLLDYDTETIGIVFEYFEKGMEKYQTAVREVSSRLEDVYNEYKYSLPILS